MRASLPRATGCVRGSWRCPTHDTCHFSAVGFRLVLRCETRIDPRGFITKPRFVVGGRSTVTPLQPRRAMDARFEPLSDAVSARWRLDGADALDRWYQFVGGAVLRDERRRAGLGRGIRDADVVCGGNDHHLGLRAHLPYLTAGIDAIQ